MAKLPKFLRIRENRVDKHDGEVRFKTGSGNMTVSCMKICNITVIIGTVWSLWTWLWVRYNVPLPQNVIS